MRGGERGGIDGKGRKGREGEGKRKYNVMYVSASELMRRGELMRGGEGGGGN